MATSSIKPIEQRSVYGFVKGGKSNKDKSVTFWVAKQKFVLPESSSFSRALHLAQKAYVRLEIGSGSNPRVLEVLSDPSTKVMREKMET